MSYSSFYLNRVGEITTKREGRRIVLYGVPFDGTSSFRSGARFGPSSFRSCFWEIELYDPVLKRDAEDLAIEDRGDLIVGDVNDIVRIVKDLTNEIINEGNIPATIGGEHTLTLGSILALPRDITVIVFDAHLDFRDELNNTKLNHATFLKRAVEKRTDIDIVHVGARAASEEEWKNARERLTIIEGFKEKWLEEFVKEVKDKKRIYVSIDLDVLDPAFAPGVSNPEPGGLSIKELFKALYSLKDKEIVGFDVVELCPPFDSGITAISAAKIFSILGILSGVWK